MTRMPKMSETLAETLHQSRARAVPPLRPQRGLLAVLVGGAVALSVVLASMMPARADDNRDLVRALVAIGVVGVLANEISNDRDDTVQVDHRQPEWKRHHPVHPSPSYPEPKRRARIPAACAIEIDVEGNGGRDLAVYPESCLQDYGIDRLPRHCGRDVRFYGQRDRVYPEACLRAAGFRFGDGGRGYHERPD
jgi:hypothetical protein